MLCCMTLSNTASSVKVGSNLSDPFETKRGLRQGGPLLFILFNLMLEGVLEMLEYTVLAQSFNKSVQLLAYGDHINIIGLSKWDVTAAISAISMK